ncbi:MAG: UDP-N-acetylmuramoyl-L-alanine--D-glutamate ligase [Candidatus Eisenbacteria bacterium]|uniref:UDP-N-acetylmuramoylalanine--D-glutamate ligase n=1 Tax=Eiseniibacteriota bacterium TaxID=2212470 RepID=A0A538UBA1_UNCEI|nr:MAG: UDP-N-acetylmuramoyl-L-alanine--D-glutamate ligase [Candidatus Eisenbacteria bacterium]
MTIDARHPLPGTRPLVMGAARSGLAAARLLKRHGAEVRLADRRFAETGGAARAMQLRREGVADECAADQPDALAGRDLVVLSPGIPVEHPVGAAARARGIPVISELELGFLAARAPLICITGTNGKSTTTDLVGALVRAAGREVAVCGNIGRALCEVAESVSATGLLVVEVSSFQLETVDRLRPFVATWLNLTPDHLERHGDLKTYGALKQRLFARQQEGDWSVWNADDRAVMSRRSGAAAPLEFSAERPVDEGAFAQDGRIALAWRGGVEPLMPAAELRLPGAHNRSNALAALATVLPLEIAPDTLREVLRGYAGLEHRLEPVATVEGVRFVNDSKATNVRSLEVALKSFDEPVVLIAGGRDKGQDFTPLGPLVARHVACLVLIGEGAERIAAAWPGVPAVRADTLERAVDEAFRHARPTSAGGRAGVVLLSPACASYDMFQDYEDRGRKFKAEVERLRVAGVAS